MENVWVKLPREILNSEVIFKDSDHLAVYIFLLLNAVFEDGMLRVSFNGEYHTLSAGEVITSVREISNFTKVEKMKVHRILRKLRDEKIIDTVSKHDKTLVVIRGWEDLNGTVDTANDTPLIHRKEKQDEKEKSSKREKEEIKEHIKKERIPPISPKEGFSTFDTDDFFQAALERSNRLFKEGGKREKAEAN